MELLRELTGVFGPSGKEENIRSFILEKIEKYVDDITVDALGNLIAHKKGSGAKVMFAAHMDEIGIMVTFIDEKGFLRFAPVGGVDPYACLYRKVKFANGKVGVISYEEDGENLKNLKLNKMFIDVGASSQEEAKESFKIGDMAVFLGEFDEIGNQVTSKALDNRAGCYVLIKAIMEMPRTDNDLYFVFTSQEEVGLRGARTSSYGINPDYAFAIDVTDTGDTPGCRPMAVSLGKGPAVKIKDNSILTHPKAQEIMFACANEKKIPYQLEILEFGGTDAGAIHVSGYGVITGALSIPTRYIHSQTECINKEDLKASVELTKGLMEFNYEK